MKDIPISQESRSIGERTEVLLVDDLRQYLYNRYAKDGITPGEVDGILFAAAEHLRHGVRSEQGDT